MPSPSCDSGECCELTRAGAPRWLAMDAAVPSDTALLEAAGWSDVPSARVLAKASTDRFCVVVLDSNGGLGARPYETVEFFFRTDDDAWHNAGDMGPAGDDGGGWHTGHAYVYGRSAEDCVVVEFNGERYSLEPSSSGWWAFVHPQEGFDATSVPHVVR